MFKVLDDLATAVGNKDSHARHHERWDGTGYPRGLKSAGIARR